MCGWNPDSWVGVHLEHVVTWTKLGNTETTKANNKMEIRENNPSYKSKVPDV